MRIDPQRDTIAVERPTATTSTSSTGFANALVTARNSLDPSLPASTDASNAAEVPVAQRWGQYGPGATADGYGTPPDPSQFADVPVGPDEPASPLNPSGVTTTPGFTVDGYTARGTPVPPGFYNLAYYNWYLRDGGTPLEGFPQLADGATLTETYGKYGDGATRATSFITTPPDGGDGSTPAKPGDGGTPASLANVADALAHAIAAAHTASPTSTGAAVPPSAASAPPSAPIAASPPPAMAADSAPPTVSTSSLAATSMPASAAPSTDNVAATLRADLTALLSDLLRA